MQIEIRTITPAQAALMLENNPANRPIKREHVASIARDMAHGRWQTNGDAIRLNCDGSLIDGQHRLTACVEAGVPFETLVISGLPSNVRATIDGGAKRSHGDRLSMLGVANANTVASITRLVAGIATGQGRRERLTSQEADAILRANPGIHTSASVCHKAFKGLGTILGSIHYIGHATGNGVKAEAYVDVFRTGVPAYQGCAAHALRERIIKHSNEISRYSVDDTIKAACATWRHFLTDTPVKQIKMVSDIRIPGWTTDRLGF
jgi:hypothetical protein